MQARERAEIARSSIEATLTPDAALRTGAKNLARYDRPPGDTPYPLEYAFHLLGDVRGLRVLDLGCGSGANSVLFANRGAHVWAVDVSEDLIRLGQRRLAVNGRAGAARFIVGSAHDLPLADDSVDIVFGIAILHHLDLALVSKEVHRVLKPGGRAIFQEPVRNSPVIRFLRPMIPCRAPDISPYEHPLTNAELRAFEAPFTLVRSRAFGLPFVAAARLLACFRGQTDRVYRVDARLLQRLPSLAHYAGIRVFELIKPARVDSRLPADVLTHEVHEDEAFIGV